MSWELSSGLDKPVDMPLRPRERPLAARPNRKLRRLGLEGTKPREVEGGALEARQRTVARAARASTDGASTILMTGGSMKSVEVCIKTEPPGILSRTTCVVLVFASYSWEESFC